MFLRASGLCALFDTLGCLALRTEDGRDAFPGLLYKEGVFTRGAALINGTIPQGIGAIGVGGACVKDLAFSRPLLRELTLTSRSRTGDPGGQALREFALGIVAARDKFPKAAISDHQGFLAVWAIPIQRFRADQADLTLSLIHI